MLARLLGAVCEHGEERVRLALEAAIAQHRFPTPGRSAPKPVNENVAVPDALAAESGGLVGFARMSWFGG